MDNQCCPNSRFIYSIQMRVVCIIFSVLWITVSLGASGQSLHNNSTLRTYRNRLLWRCSHWFCMWIFIYENLLLYLSRPKPPIYWQSHWELPATNRVSNRSASADKPAFMPSLIVYSSIAHRFIFNFFPFHNNYCGPNFAWFMSSMQQRVNKRYQNDFR